MPQRNRRHSRLVVVVAAVIVMTLAGSTPNATVVMRAEGATWRQEHSGIPVPTASTAVVQGAGYIVSVTTSLATIFHSIAGRQSLAEGEHVVIDAGVERPLALGDRLTVVRPLRAVHHPIHAQAVGTLVMPLGHATVVDVRPTLATLVITNAFDAIEIGDQVQVFEPPRPASRRVAAAPSSITGFIVATKDNRVSVGQGDIVYLDRGAKQGVQVGDRFHVFLEGELVRHPVSHQRLHLPRQVVGELAVIVAQEETATALVTASRREFSAGVPVVSIPEGERHLPQAAEGPSSATRGDEAAAAASERQAPAATGRQGQEPDRQRTERVPGLPERYTVVRGDTLWGIAAQERIYRNAFMWPLIYRANREQIRDPDLLFPRQVFSIPRDYTPAEAEVATQRARTRGPWRVGDGDDRYILEGIRP